MEHNDALLLKNYHNLAYKYALYKTNSLEAAEDIASQTIYSYLLKRDKIFHDNQGGWIINTSKNFCNKYFERLKREKKLHKLLKENLIDEVQSKIDNCLEYVKEDKLKLSNAISEVMKTLTEKEMQTYVFYLQCDGVIREMSKISGESYAVLRQRISRVKRKIKAETYKKLGMIATKKILTPQISDIIQKFLIRFKKNLESNTLYKMYHYFSFKDISDYHPTFNIKQVLEYEVNLEDSVYMIHVVFMNEKNETDSFYFTFKVENNALKVLKLPTPHQKHVRFSVEDSKEILKLLEKYPEDNTGMHQLPDDAMALFKKLIGEEEE